MSGTIHILGGMTVNYMRAHFALTAPAPALTAPANGGTARGLHEALWVRGLNTKLHLTKWSSAGASPIETNAELLEHTKKLIADPDTRAIIFNPAVTDYEGEIDGMPSGKYANRLKSRAQEMPIIKLTPSPKIAALIKPARPDIFLVTFKATTHEEREEQIHQGLAQIKGSQADLVLANDTGTRNNILIAKDGRILKETTNRHVMMKALTDAFCREAGFTQANRCVQIYRRARLEASRFLSQLAKRVGPPQ